MNTTKQEQITARAYALWDAAGRPEGQSDRFWYEAEQEIGSMEMPNENEPPKASLAADAKKKKKINPAS